MTEKNTMTKIAPKSHTHIHARTHTHKEKKNQTQSTTKKTKNKQIKNKKANQENPQSNKTKSNQTTYFYPLVILVILLTAHCVLSSLSSSDKAFNFTMSSGSVI